MTRPSGFTLRTTVAAAMIVLAFLPEALGQGRPRLRDDQIPFGPQGTIGRGTDTYGRYADVSGVRLFSGNLSRATATATATAPLNPNGGTLGGYFSTPTSAPTPPAATISTAAGRPYMTDRYFEPGDGNRYPLYYNPATRTYTFYPRSR